MCGGARYVDSAGKDWKIYFPNPKAALPVLRSDGEIEWIKWGKRREEVANTGFIQGGWARLDSINAGKWDRLKPQRVVLAVTSFMEKDESRASHWIELEPDQALEALVITIEEESRLYVITEDTPLAFAWVHDRWPHIVQKPKR